MFFAINSKTNEKVNSLSVELNPSYQFIQEEEWFADVDEIESCPKEIDINKIIVRFRKGAEAISVNGKEYDISPHFYIPNKSKLGINTIPESKEHKLAKNWIYNKIKSKSLIINYSEIKRPYKYNNSMNLFDLPIDYSKVGIETSVSTFGGNKLRRADIICPFLKRHPLFGDGINFEIQFSKQQPRTKEDRELDWAIRGYSISWIFKGDFEEIGENQIELKNDSVNVSSFASLIKFSKKQFVKKLKYTVQEECRKIDNKVRDMEYKIDMIISSKLDEKVKNIKIGSIQPICPRCNLPMLLKGDRSGKNKFWGCANYPICRCTSKYVELQ
jgi:hypothetical protein